VGHTRLGNIPKTQKWGAVVAMVASSGGSGVSSGAISIAENVPAIAEKSLDAAQNGLRQVSNDPGLAFSFYLLTQTVLAARGEDWTGALSNFGMDLTADGALIDLVGEIQGAVEAHVYAQLGRMTDVSEMSLGALGDALTELVAPNSETLFGNGIDELQTAVRELSTKQGYSRLGQIFFGRFMKRYLNFYLSRTTASHTGNVMVASDITAFNQALEKHCEQSAKIVYQFAGDWMSKTQYLTGITPENTTSFVAIAVRKLRAELQKQGTDR
jgi:hypothetical protein